MGQQFHVALFTVVTMLKQRGSYWITKDISSSLYMTRFVYNLTYLLLCRCSRPVRKQELTF